MKKLIIFVALLASMGCYAQDIPPVQYKLYVAVAIQLVNTQNSVLSGIIPANGLVRLRSATTGTASATFVSAQEMVL